MPEPLHGIKLFYTLREFTVNFFPYLEYMAQVQHTIFWLCTQAKPSSFLSPGTEWKTFNII